MYCYIYIYIYKQYLYIYIYIHIYIYVVYIYIYIYMYGRQISTYIARYYIWAPKNPYDILSTVPGQRWIEYHRDF